MKLFKISQKINRGWDTYSDAVVVAPDELTASTIHPDTERRVEWPYVESDKEEWYYDIMDWANFPEQVVVEYIGEAAEHLSQGAVICASFHAG